MTDSLSPGAVIGILGGGQLGRMLSMAATRLGFRSHILDSTAESPAAQVAGRATVAAFDDAAALADFAASVDVITYEFENIPVRTLDVLASVRSVRPNRRALWTSQDRLTEKEFLSGLGLVTAPFRDIPDHASLTSALADIGTPAILKTRRLGYDGKGQVRIDSPGELDAAFDSMNGAPSIIEGVVDFSREISVIAARGLSGEVVCYDPGENVHSGGILRTTTVPAHVSAQTRANAALLAGKILNALDYVGVIGVELFLTGPSGIVVNEFAPRVHNSGHWTQQGCAVDQFEQHIRAVAGWPLGDGVRHADVVMENLIGNDLDQVPRIARERDASLHLYGKTGIRPGRKMGHVNRIFRRG